MKIGDSEDKLYEIEGNTTQVTQISVNNNKVFITHFYQVTNISYVVDKTRKAICKIRLGKTE